MFPSPPQRVHVSTSRFKSELIHRESSSKLTSDTHGQSTWIPFILLLSTDDGWMCEHKFFFIYFWARLMNFLTEKPMFWEFWIFSSLKIITIYEIRVFCSCFWKVKRKTFLLFFSRYNNKERVFNIFPFFFLRVPLSFVLSSFPALRNFMPINFIKLLSHKTFPKHRKFVFSFAHSLCAVNNFSLRSPSHLFQRSTSSDCGN